MNAKVLLVDDEPAVLKCLSAALTRFGYTVTAVSTGRAALEELGRERFDLVVTDFRMPDFLGDAVVDAIRAHRPETAILLITGFIDELPQHLRAGPEAVQVLAKPFSLASLRSAMDAILRRSTALLI